MMGSFDGSSRLRNSSAVWTIAGLTAGADGGEDARRDSTATSLTAGVGEVTSRISILNGPAHLLAQKRLARK